MDYNSKKKEGREVKFNFFLLVLIINAIRMNAKVIGHEVVIAVYYKPHWALLVSFTPPGEL